ncbi:hypothetical protein [Actinoplanes sp. L3-i22]|uniref:hypothetical protein n=1 Tax=Actinoplanes sp. L3-i22 TaxID=2836373 RepID=UPI001C74A7AC|nr:hypothetical protein [Actinoplanes sp. L3-i22]BCY15059.1 hypothetical protein L3i22_101470 [Actinoplanes sp. L3-i22]
MGRSRDQGERLDPVRWRPSRGGLLRLAAIAVLLVTAAGLVWFRSAVEPCAVPVTAATAAADSTAAAGSTAAAALDRGAAPQVSGRPAIPTGRVGVPVRLADPTALSLVHPGNLVDLLRLDNEGDSTRIASAALVLDVTGADDPMTGGLLLALAPEQAGQAVAGQGHGFAILIRPG